ncbi:MAG: universal stress protein [Candidatus Methylomirabilales bacterium]
MWRRILVPLDGSARGETVVPGVVLLAMRCRAMVLLLRVVRAHRRPGADPIETQVRVLTQAETYLADVERRLVAQGLRVDPAVRYGPAAETILDHAAVRKADVIVMARPSSRLAALATPFGGIVGAVLRKSPVPVLLLPPMPMPQERVGAPAGMALPAAA